MAVPTQFSSSSLWRSVVATADAASVAAAFGNSSVVAAAESALTLGNLAGTLSIAKGGSGQTTATAAINALLPSQPGNNFKVLYSNGTTASWVALDAAPLRAILDQIIFDWAEANGGIGGGGGATIYDTAIYDAGVYS